MKFNWGTGIVLSFIIFALSIAFIIIFPFNQKVDLVTDNYYQKELQYQEQIDKTSRTKLLADDISVTQNKKTLEILFPESYGRIYGEIMFYRPSDSVKDFSKEIMIDTTGKQIIDISGLAPGLWKIKISWKMEELEYYYEKALVF